MIYYKKNHLPENLSSLNELISGNNKTINEFMIYLINSKKLNKKDIKNIFLKYFDKKINIKIKKNYILLISKFLDELFPILLNQNHPKQASYQLLRFLNEISPNFEFVEKLLSKKFIYKKLSEILSFSGHITNMLAKDDTLLEILDPYYAIRLKGNITIYKNELNKISFYLENEETILNKLRQLHRKLKFQIIVSVITNELRIENASYEFSILARAVLEKVIEICHYLFLKQNKLRKSFLDEFGILAYGRLANNTMTSNSDLDLVFIFPDHNTNFKNQKEYSNFYNIFSKKIINFLSSKTSEGILYEVDTKLTPSNKYSDLACKVSDFVKFQKNQSYAWQKLALLKSELVFKNSVFQNSLETILENIKEKKINLYDLKSEINSMRKVNKNRSKQNLLKNNEIRLLNWYETKYSLGGQRDIEFLEYFYKRKEFDKVIENLVVKKLFLKNVKSFYFILDQFINITFWNEKPENLPNKVSKYLVEYLDLKDLGSLKKKISDHKNQVHGYLQEILNN